MDKKFVCGLCGKTHYDLDEYMNCVARCGKELKKLEKEEAERKRADEINAAINRIKQAEEYLEEQKKIMKEKYPKEYELNFGLNDTCNCPSDCKGYCSDEDDTEDNTEDVSKLSTKFPNHETITIKVIDDGNGNPKIDAKINGKKVDDKVLSDLSIDPETILLSKFKMLGLL